MDFVLESVHYLQFQAIETIEGKVKYLIKNKEELESNYNIKVDNLIWHWESLK